MVTKATIHKEGNQLLSISGPIKEQNNSPMNSYVI